MTTALQPTHPNFDCAASAEMLMTLDQPVGQCLAKLGKRSTALCHCMAHLGSLSINMHMPTPTAQAWKKPLLLNRFSTPLNRGSCADWPGLTWLLDTGQQHTPWQRATTQTPQQQKMFQSKR
jgi:hypothetical protein